MPEAAHTGGGGRRAKPRLVQSGSAGGGSGSVFAPGGGGGGGNQYATIPFVEAKVETLRAEIAATEERLRGDISHLPTRWHLFWIVSGVVAAGVGALWIIVQALMVQYQDGLQAGSVGDREAMQQIQRSIERLEENQQSGRAK